MLELTETEGREQMVEMSLYGPDGSVVFSSSGWRATATFDFRAKQTGFYSVLIRGYGGSGTGPYQLMLTGATSVLVNHAPVLETIARQTNIVGRTLTIQVSGSDEDFPSNELRYSLDPGAPAGASIDPITGVFAWTPGPASASTTNSITVRVTDNGSPALSAVRSFAVVVRPPGELRLSAVLFSSGQLQLTLSAEPGRSYSIEASSNLRDWVAITNIVSTATSLQIVDPGLLAIKQRFYRAVSP